MIVILPDSSLSSSLLTELLSYKTHLIMFLSCLSTAFSSLFFSYRFKSKFLSLAQSFRDQPDLSCHCYFSPFPLANLMFWTHSVVHCCPNKNVKPFVDCVYLLFAFAWPIRLRVKSPRLSISCFAQCIIIHILPHCPHDTLLIFLLKAFTI